MVISYHGCGCNWKQHKGYCCRLFLRIWDKVQPLSLVHCLKSWDHGLTNCNRKFMLYCHFMIEIFASIELPFMLTAVILLSPYVNTKSCKIFTGRKERIRGNSKANMFSAHWPAYNRLLKQRNEHCGCFHILYNGESHGWNLVYCQCKCIECYSLTFHMWRKPPWF